MYEDLDWKVQAVVRAVHDLPWAREQHMQAYTQQSKCDWVEGQREAESTGLIQLGPAGLGEASDPDRWGPTDRLLEQLGNCAAWNRAQLDAVYLAQAQFDIGRALVAGLGRYHQLDWVKSPCFWRRHKLFGELDDPAAAFSAVDRGWMDALVHLILGPTAAVTLGIIVDQRWYGPGVLPGQLEAFLHASHSGEIVNPDALLVLTDHPARIEQALAFWRGSGRPRLAFFIADWHDVLDEPTGGQWLTVNGWRVDSLLNEFRTLAAAMPREKVAAQWPAPSMPPRDFEAEPAFWYAPGSPEPDRWRQALAGRLWAQTDGLQRDLLELIGARPNSTMVDLAACTHLRAKRVRPALAALNRAGLIRAGGWPLGQPDADGWLLTDDALVMLAGMAGLSPFDYLRARGWLGDWWNDTLHYDSTGVYNVSHKVSVSLAAGIQRRVAAPWSLQVTPALAGDPWSGCLERVDEDGRIREAEHFVLWVHGANLPWENALRRLKEVCRRLDGRQLLVVVQARSTYPGQREMWAERDRARQGLPPLPPAPVPDHPEAEARQRRQDRLSQLRRFLRTHQLKTDQEIDARLTWLDWIEMHLGMLEPQRPVWYTLDQDDEPMPAFDWLTSIGK